MKCLSAVLCPGTEWFCHCLLWSVIFQIIILHRIYLTEPLLIYGCLMPFILISEAYMKTKKIFLYLFHSFQFCAIFPLFFPLSSVRQMQRNWMSSYCANTVSLILVFFSLVICKCHPFRKYSLNFPEHFILSSLKYIICIHLHCRTHFYLFYLPRTGQNQIAPPFIFTDYTTHKLFRKSLEWFQFLKRFFVVVVCPFSFSKRLNTKFIAKISNGRCVLCILTLPNIRIYAYITSNLCGSVYQLFRWS